MEEYKEFLIKLFKQLSTGNFTVMVNEYPADIIGYSDENMTVRVRYHSDELTRPGTKRVESFRWSFSDEQEYDLVECRIPVKVENVWWENIK
jgi:hypothetical protein